MKDGICHIVSAGDFSAGLLPDRATCSLLVAADAGYRALKDVGLEPDVFIGDGDSLGFIPHAHERIVLPCEKDDTDTFAAVKYGLEKGYREFRLYGALGGRRFSHSVANVLTLLFIAENCGHGEIVDEDCTVTLILPGEKKSVPKDVCRYFSLFPVGDEAVVSVRGAKYSGEAIRLTQGSALGASNEPSDGCEISAISGKVLLICETENK